MFAQWLNVSGGFAMRYIKALFVIVSVTVMLLTVEIVLRLPTEREIALVGPDHARSDLAQMRLARMILMVDAARGSQALGLLTDTDPQVIEANLRVMSRIDVETSGYSADGSADDPEEALPRVRRISGGTGGARFVKVN